MFCEFPYSITHLQRVQFNRITDGKKNYGAIML